MDERTGRPSTEGPTDREIVDLRGAQGVQVGDNNIQTNIFGGTVTVATPQAPSWPVRVGPIPLLAGCYQERDEAWLLSDAIAEGGTAVVTQVLSGLGGVGKTQLAAAYARSRTDVDLLIWITASSRDAILTGYAQAATRLGHPSAEDTEQAARWLLTWLQATTERSWLIVLDDLADPADLRGLWPDGPRGRTVVTTRRTDAALAGPGRRRVDVGLFTTHQARAYLAARLDAGPGDERMREADELAADLGHLPLALAQAAAFILDRGDTCARYRARLADRRRNLAELLPPDALADDYHDTVAATWSISIDAADALPPAGLARPVLELLSVLDPNGIPTDLLTTQAAVVYASRQGTTPRDGQDLLDALHHLARLSLITVDPADGAAGVRVHGLVQRATVERLDPVVLALLHRAVATGLVAIWPEIERDSRLGQVLRANAVTLIARAGPNLWQPATHMILKRAGDSLGQSGLYHAATRYWAQLASDAHRYFGPDHPDTLSARHNVAHWQGEAGDPAGAASAQEQVLIDRSRVLGPDHPATLTTRHNLAHWRGKAGDPAGAAVEFEKLLTEFLRVQGPDHPDTFTARSNLAAFRGMAGDAAGAAAAYEQLHTDHIRVLGRDHPDTLIIGTYLARWRGDAGDPAGAADALEQLLDDHLRVLGPDHLNTLATRASLARCRGHAGDPAGAAAALEQLLEDEQRIHGADNPSTLVTRYNIADWRGRAGDPAGAATALEGLLDDHLRILGPDNPGILTTRQGLARWRGEAGDPAGAANALEQLLDDQRRVLGPDHPEIRATRVLLARNRSAADDHAGAVTALEGLLDDQRRVLGTDNPETLTTRAILARWKEEAGDPAGAITILEQLLTDQRRILGPDHADTLATHYDLALLRGKAGDPAGAAADNGQVVTDLRRVLGPDDPTTLTARTTLAMWIRETGDLAGAITALEQLLADELRALGPDHPTTSTTRQLLDMFRDQAARPRSGPCS